VYISVNGKMVFVMAEVNNYGEMVQYMKDIGEKIQHKGKDV